MDKNLTESESAHQELEKKSTLDLLSGINEEDKKVAFAVEKVIPQLEQLIDEIVPRMQSGGRLFYIGAGTSGRLGIVDASECPPTFGVSHELVTGLIAGGDGAIRKAVEFAEDDKVQGWKDLMNYGITDKDSLVGIAASGRTPYVIGALKKANENGVLTGCITCNEGSNLAKVSKFPIEVLVGSEFVTGSTRMKAGTAQKLVLNMISTTVMIKLGRVKGNKMVDMQLTNHKLNERAVRMILSEVSISEKEAKSLLDKYGSVRKVIEYVNSGS